MFSELTTYCCTLISVPCCIMMACLMVSFYGSDDIFRLTVSKRQAKSYTLTFMRGSFLALHNRICLINCYKTALRWVKSTVMCHDSLHTSLGITGMLQ